MIETFTPSSFSPLSNEHAFDFEYDVKLDHCKASESLHRVNTRLQPRRIHPMFLSARLDEQIVQFTIQSSLLSAASFVVAIKAA
ncbi:MAG: hypothetical protein JWQ71_4220 [Pedosphaera sp.]|nr:hypothetical protein [Pedosphaera sp.]